ncbi:hypothetical protein ABH14_15075 [Brevibacillus brevis]|uniref:hypothetical protein n=1 Tax=Brevibacillus brevis TaxID=1393 RepID=UPI001F5B69D4|nr:hypothetical protein [Brevibacillus brevis]MBH0331109.1 hypothetical protein [Brevibacillus brevis]
MKCPDEKNINERRELTTNGVDEQLDWLENNIPGFHRGQGQILLEGAYSRNSSVVFGGSRIRGNYSETSDLDVGFDNLSPSQASKLLKKADKVEGGLPIEKTIIVPGNSTPNIPKIESPEEFFQRTGQRLFPDSRGDMSIKPSGSITVKPDGKIIIIPPGGLI